MKITDHCYLCDNTRKARFDAKACHLAFLKKYVCIVC